MEIKTKTKTVYLGIGGKEFDTIDDAIKSIVMDTFTDFLYNNAGNYEPDYTNASEALYKLIGADTFIEIYKAIK